MCKRLDFAEGICAVVKAITSILEIAHADFSPRERFSAYYFPDTDAQQIRFLRIFYANRLLRLQPTTH